MNIIHWLQDHFLDVIAYAVAIASVIVKLTPNSSDDTVLAKIISIFKVLSLYKEPGTTAEPPKDEQK